MWIVVGVFAALPIPFMTHVTVRRRRRERETTEARLSQARADRAARHAVAVAQAREYNRTLDPVRRTWTQLCEPVIVEGHEDDDSVYLVRNWESRSSRQEWRGWQPNLELLTRLRERRVDTRPETAAMSAQLRADYPVNDGGTMRWWAIEEVSYDTERVEVVLGDRPDGDGWSAIPAFHPEATPAWVRPIAGADPPDEHAPAPDGS